LATTHSKEILNTSRDVCVKVSMTPRPRAESTYQSKYWARLNGMVEDSAFLAAEQELMAEFHSERENILLDVIGAYDLLRWQGLTAERAAQRLGLSKSRDALLEELDAETARRLAVHPRV
jgi:hypothetical protein